MIRPADRRLAYKRRGPEEGFDTGRLSILRLGLLSYTAHFTMKPSLLYTIRIASDMHTKVLEPLLYASMPGLHHESDAEVSEEDASDDDTVVAGHTDEPLRGQADDAHKLSLGMKTALLKRMATSAGDSLLDAVAEWGSCNRLARDVRREGVEKIIFLVDDEGAQVRRIKYWDTIVHEMWTTGKADFEVGAFRYPENIGILDDHPEEDGDECSARSWLQRCVDKMRSIKASERVFEASLRAGRDSGGSGTGKMEEWFREELARLGSRVEFELRRAVLDGVLGDHLCAIKTRLWRPDGALVANRASALAQSGTT